MNTQPLPLPETAFASWQDFVREFGRALRIMRQYGDAPNEQWATFSQTHRVAGSILNPSRIDRRTLPMMASGPQPESALNVVKNWTATAEERDRSGFAAAAKLAHRKAQIFRNIDWGKIPPYRALETTGSLPEAMQAELDQFYEEERTYAQTEDLHDIRAHFQARPDLYQIMPDDAFNVHMVETICTSAQLKEELEKVSNDDQAANDVFATNHRLRKAFGKGAAQAGLQLYRELWEYLPQGASDTTRRSLWFSKVGLLLVVETPHGTDDDIAPYSIDVAVSAWASGARVAAFTYEESTKASRAAALAAGHVHIDQFTDAAQRLTSNGKSGLMGWMHRAPLLSSLIPVFIAALHPRLNFRFFRGMAQQGVKSGTILRQVGRAVFWSLLLWVLSATGITRIILAAFFAGIATWSDIAFIVGLLLAFVLLCQSIPSALGLLVGSFDRRAGKGWASNLPTTGYENFITRSGKQPTQGWPKGHA